MKNVIGAAIAETVATPAAQAERLAALRFMVLDTVNYSPYATADEKARTAASVARCQCAETLVKWYCNLLTLLAQREEAPAPVAAPAPAPTVELAPTTAPVVYATAEQKQEIIRLCNHPAVTRARKTTELRRLNQLTQAQAAEAIAALEALTTTPPTRPAGAGLVVNRRGQLALAALTCYATKATTDGGVSASYVRAA